MAKTQLTPNSLVVEPQVFKNLDEKAAYHLQEYQAALKAMNPFIDCVIAEEPYAYGKKKDYVTLTTRLHLGEKLN